MPRTCTINGPAAPIHIGSGRPLVIIAGPCVLESKALAFDIARTLKACCDQLGLPYIFKASFDKANRTSITSSRGPGLAAGLETLASIREELAVPVTTDIHEPAQAEAVAEVADLLQIPAFLCRQTDLLLAVARAAQSHNRAVNIKKGQFLSPQEMLGPVAKVESAGCANIILTERGTFFGYHRLVNDFIGIGDLMELGDAASACPVCFDATHSAQLPGASSTTGGRPERVPLLARAAVAAGVHAVFLECHPDPRNAQSDASTMLALDEAPALIRSLAAIRKAVCG
ncbi:MAG: 3-deoxy-8-phosphooctulonate synthase [Phycisphaerales bacterium]|nr:3-deoxy-8-phosphooctulonate synthase [Phycisphaerales bacterium]